MNVYVFTGPTLAAAEAAGILEAVYCPPATQGDVFRAACQRPHVIAIIDGLFECVPSVWHKEILWAMSQGVHVYGSSSMGALRAAELSAFGMVGVGKIFAAYASGALEDDDEVAVAHADGAHGYLAGSIAMVNMRATLALACSKGVISRESRQVLETIAKALFYADRSYETLLERSTDLVSGEDRKALQSWLPSGQVDQKRLDAITMLETVRAFLRTPAGPKQVQFTFQNTAAWELVLQTRNRGTQRFAADWMPYDPVMEELQLSGVLYQRLKRMAVSRFLAVRETLREGMDPKQDAIAASAADFRMSRGLQEELAFQRWLERNDLDSDLFDQLMEDQERIRWTETIAENGIWAYLLDELRMSGEYEDLAARATRKVRLLQHHGLINPALAETGISDAELVRWYFCDRIGSPVPDDVHRAAFELGFQSIKEFKRAVLREYCFQKCHDRRTPQSLVSS